MSWAGRRRFTYFSIFMSVFILVLLWIFYPVIFKSPTCFDNKKNGDERGVDCGGSCSLICKADTKDPVILWSRAFPVAGTSYNLVAMVENPNIDGAIKEVSYEFKIYDNNHLLVGTKEGTTFLPANGQYAIFGPRFDAKDNNIRSVKFDFTGEINYHKKENTLNNLPIKISNINYNIDKNSTTITALMSNSSIYNLPSYDIVGVFYDKDSNAINVSKTHKDGLKTNSKTNLTFTWPFGFSETPTSYDIIPMVNPFETDF